MYMKCNESQSAVDVWVQQKYSDVISLSTALAACAMVGPSALAVGEQIHAVIFKLRENTNLHLWNNLLNMYYQCGQPAKVVEVWEVMQSYHHLQPDSMTYSCALAAVAKIGPPALGLGEAIHTVIRQSTSNYNAQVFNALVVMYTSCGCPDLAQQIWYEFSDHTNASFVSPGSMCKCGV